LELAVDGVEIRLHWLNEEQKPPALIFLENAYSTRASYQGWSSKSVLDIWLQKTLTHLDGDKKSRREICIKSTEQKKS